MKYDLQPAPDARAEFTVGILDCMYALCLAVAEVGPLSRDDLARVFDTAIIDYSKRSDCQHPARRYAAQALAEALRGETSKTRVS